jgi:hypothetical protein
MKSPAQASPGSIRQFQFAEYADLRGGVKQADVELMSSCVAAASPWPAL